MVQQEVEAHPYTLLDEEEIIGLTTSFRQHRKQHFGVSYGSIANCPGAGKRPSAIEHGAMLTTDYLVVGAGAASMAFVDSILLQQPNASVIIVDQHVAPGGHWQDAYDYCHLHQPSLFYGVESTPLEGNWLLLLLKGLLPWTHRASKRDILEYYQDLIEKWTKSGRVLYFPRASYDFGSSSAAKQIHVIRAYDKTFAVHVNVKLVNGTVGECKVPSRTPPPFAVGDGIELLTPNELFRDVKPSSWFHRSDNGKFVVLGGGKTVSAFYCRA